MKHSSEINATYLAMRFISHRVDVSRLRRRADGAPPSDEFTAEERAHALALVERIQETEKTPIQNLSEARAAFHLGNLADRVEELANAELARAGFDSARADQLIEGLRRGGAAVGAATHPTQAPAGGPAGSEDAPARDPRAAAAELLTRLRVPFPRREAAGSAADLICLSHLRWDFVFQRPQHLMSRFGRERRVFFVEEPVYGEDTLGIDLSEREGGVHVVVPHLPQRSDAEWVDDVMQQLLNALFKEYEIGDHVLWYYTPAAVGWTRGLDPLAVVYDCMDELSAYPRAPRALKEREAELLARADLVFAGGQQLYDAKRHQHPSVYAFPSSIDRAHFARAREISADPPDQAGIPHPRLGFFGVIDERLDVGLLDAVAVERPHWQFVLIGPVVKVDPSALPRRPNIHYLGGKSYGELPSYIAGWDVATLPFALNDSTRFISPTKTPEYLAAGRPVVSTPIRDVVRPYGELGLVRIAATPGEFVAAAEAEMGMTNRPRRRAEWLASVDAFLSRTSWDRTWERMRELINEVAARVAAGRRPGEKAPLSRAAGHASIPLASEIPM